MSCKYLAHWKLPKHNFYPISMVCAVDNDQHSTTVIVASTEQVMSLSLTSIKRVQHEGKVFTHCDVELDEPIRELKKTKLNQVFLTSADGQFMVYDAGKQMFVQIDKCNRILHVEPGPEKDQLIVVRRLPGVTTMVLEVIEIAEGCTSFETVKSCELLIESIDSTARLSLKSLIVNEVNEQFLGNFLGFSKLTVGDQVLLVAANNSLYWLQEQGNGESDLISVRCFASCIIDFDFSEASLCLTVLLQAGVLVVFSQSLAPEGLLVETASIFLHAPIEAYAFEKDNNGFLYSNGLSTHRVQFYYSEESKQIVTESKEVPVRGVVAIALLEDSSSMGLLVTENNQFYTIDCTDRQQTSVGEVPKMFLLRKDNRAGSKHAMVRLTEEVQFDKRLEEAMQAVQRKFDVLALYRNRTAFEALSRMDVTFHREMPPRKGSALLLGQQKATVSLFASIKIELNKGFFELLAKQNQWSVGIEYGNSLFTFPLLETFNPEGVLYAIICLCQQDLFLGLPVFRALLMTTTQNGSENLLLSIPVPTNIESADECAARLIAKSTSPLIESRCCVRKAARSIIVQNNRHSVRGQDEQSSRLTYCIRNEQSKTRAASFSSTLETCSQDVWFAMDAPVWIRWHGERRAALFVKAESAVAMDFIKRFLLDSEEYLAENEQRRDLLKGFALELQAITEASLIVQLYRKLRNYDMIEEDILCSTEVQS